MPEQTALTTEVDAHVARICDLGCRRVYEVIAELERGQSSDATRSLSDSLRAVVLAELKAVMAIYDAREDGPSCRVG